MSRIVKLRNLGRMSYSRALAVQEQLRRTHLDSKHAPAPEAADTLILVEHEPVYTVGVRSDEYSPEVESELRRLGSDFQRVHRGGLITFHGPGQLVAYPVVDLKRLGLGVRSYVQCLERCVVGTCAGFGIEAGTTDDTGVWVERERKIAAIGVNARRYITSHGLALNCNVDLDWFSHIVPCGLEGRTVTSLSNELQRTVTVSDVTALFIESFKRTFDCDLVQ